MTKSVLAGGIRHLVSIVTPCYNEEQNVKECYESVRNVLEDVGDDYEYEHIFCDNASTDGTVEILREIAKLDSRVKVIINSRNFGAFASMYNGLMATRGDIVVPFVPADLQDPPTLIPAMLDLWTKGFEVVYGVRANRQESWLLRSARRIYYRMVSRFANIDIPENVGEFSLIDKKVVDSLRKYDDYYPYLRGMIASCGFKSTSIPYTWNRRKRGFSKTGIYALADAGLNGLISFTNLPMRLCMFGGFIIALLSIVYASFTAVFSLIYYQEFTAPGIPTLITALFFFSGINLFFLGLLGEYISAIHFQVRKRPLVIERERINCS